MQVQFSKSCHLRQPHTIYLLKSDQFMQRHRNTNKVHVGWSPIRERASRVGEHNAIRKDKEKVG